MKTKNTIYKTFYTEKKPQQKKNLWDAVQHLQELSYDITENIEDGYYKIDFEENKKIENCPQTIKEIINVKSNSDVTINSLLILWNNNECKTYCRSL